MISKRFLILSLFSNGVNILQGLSLTKYNFNYVTWFYSASHFWCPLNKPHNFLVSYSYLRTSQKVNSNHECYPNDYQQHTGRHRIDPSTLAEVRRLESYNIVEVKIARCALLKGQKTSLVYSILLADWWLFCLRELGYFMRLAWWEADCTDFYLSWSE